MKHYWINIDRCVDRFEFMSKQLENKDIENYRISAETPETITKYDVKKHEYADSTKEEDSCMLSHLKAIQKGYDDGDEYFCVVEDDIEIQKLDFEKILDYVNDIQIKKNETIGMVQLHTNSNVGIIELYKSFGKTGNILEKRDEFAYPSTGYYLISRVAAAKILNKFKINNGTFDLSYSTWCAADCLLYMHVVVYIISYPVAISKLDYGSIIHPSHLIHHKNANDVANQIWQQNNMLDMFV